MSDPVTMTGQDSQDVPSKPQQEQQQQQEQHQQQQQEAPFDMSVLFLHDIPRDPPSTPRPTRVIKTPPPTPVRGVGGGEGLLLECPGTPPPRGGAAAAAVTPRTPRQESPFTTPRVNPAMGADVHSQHIPPRPPAPTRVAAMRHPPFPVVTNAKQRSDCPPNIMHHLEPLTLPPLAPERQEDYEEPVYDDHGNEVPRPHYHIATTHRFDVVKMHAEAEMRLALFGPHATTIMGSSSSSPMLGPVGGRLTVLSVLRILNRSQIPPAALPVLWPRYHQHQARRARSPEHPTRNNMKKRQRHEE